MLIATIVVVEHISCERPDNERHVYAQVVFGSLRIAYARWLEKEKRPR